MNAIDKTSLRAIIYARVSTDDQADKGYSLPTQIEVCCKYAERMGFTVVGNKYYDVHTALEVIQKQGTWVFVDSAKAARLAEEGPMKPIDPVPAFVEDCSGGIPIADRPEGGKVAAMFNRREADAIVVYQVDRLSRDIVNLLAHVQMWTRAGVQVHACDMGRIRNELDIVLVIKGWQGSDEKEKIRERTMRGRSAKAKNGRVVGTNRAPYGYRFIRDQNNKVIGLEISEEEAGIVRLIFQWYTQDRLSMLGIARKLEGMGTPTPGENGYMNRGARGIWGCSQVKGIIENETYAGVWHYGRHTIWIERPDKQKRRYFRTPVEQHIAIEVPAIVGREVWQAALAQRARNKQMSKRNSKHDFLLRCLLQCGCGRQMSGATTGTGQRCYRCTGHFYIKRDCHESSVMADTFEAEIWKDLRGFFRDLNRLERELKIAQQEELDQQEPKRAELEAIEANIGHAEREADDIAADIPKVRGKVKESLLRDADEVNARYEALTKRRVELQADLGSRKLTDEAIGDILTYARDVREGIEAIETQSFEKRRRLLELLGVGIEVKNSLYKGNCVLGEWEGNVPRRKVIANDVS